MLKQNFMLTFVGIAVLGGWWLQTIVGTTAIQPAGLSAPAGVDAGDRSITAIPPPRRENIKCAFCGVVVSMRPVTVAVDATSGSTAGSAVVGGMIGNLLGGARGQELFGWLGAVAAMRNGATLEPGLRYETTVRFDNGSSRVFVETALPRWQAGDRVKVVEGAIRAFDPEDAKRKAEVTLSCVLPVAPAWI